jgi:hypothetical protein
MPELQSPQVFPMHVKVWGTLVWHAGSQNIVSEPRELRNLLEMLWAPPQISWMWLEGGPVTCDKYILWSFWYTLQFENH